MVWERGSALPAPLRTRRRLLPPLRPEPLLFLQLHAIPRWVSEQQIEAATPASGLALCDFAFSRHAEHIRERELPVEELVLVAQALDFVAHPRGTVMWIALDFAQHVIGDWIRHVARPNITLGERKLPQSHDCRGDDFITNPYERDTLAARVAVAERSLGLHANLRAFFLEPAKELAEFRAHDALTRQAGEKSFDCVEHDPLRLDGVREPRPASRGRRVRPPDLVRFLSVRE
jgi:hypothetical protein